MQNARESLGDVDLVLNESRVFRKLRQYLRSEQTSPARAARLHAELQAISRKLHAVAKASSNPYFLETTLDNLARIFEGRESLSPERLALYAEEGERAVRQWVRRLNDLFQAVRSKTQMDQLRSECEAAGFADVRIGVEHQDADHLLAWSLTMTRS